MGQTYQSIVINLPVESVWDAICNFHDLSWTPNVVTSVEIVGEAAGDQIGAGRVLNGVFRETLHEIDAESKTFAYSIDDGPPPISKADVSNYVGRVKVQENAEGGTLVEWSSSWEQNDEPAYEFCHGIYMALLDDMKRTLE